MERLTLSQKIKAVLLSDYTSFKLSKETGVSEVSIALMRSGTRKIDNLTVKNAEKLIEFYYYLEDRNELPTIEQIYQNELGER